MTGNTTPENGGGIYDFDGTFTLLGSSTVTANSAGLNGGGIFLQQVFDGTLINCISGVNVTANSTNDIFP